MDPLLEIKRKEVRSWLHEIFEDEEVPEFEVNEETIEYLHHMMQDSHNRDNHLKLVTKDFQEKTKEYSSEGLRLSGILQRLQLTPSSLSRQGQTSLSTLSKLAMLLDVKDTSDTCYMLAMEDLDKEFEATTEASETETDHLNKLTLSYRNTLHQCNALQKVLVAEKEKMAENQELNVQKENKTTFCVQKIKNYEREMSKMKAKLLQCKFEESLDHKNLVKKSEALKDIQAQLEPLKEELKSLSVLPPDLDKAKMKLAEYKLELEKMDKHLSECIENVMM